MAAFRCPKHGMQIAAHFCEHAADAINERRPTELYLQHGEWAWFTLCDVCIRRRNEPEVVEIADFLVCQECIIEWAEATNSDYVQRCQSPVPELPAE